MMEHLLHNTQAWHRKKEFLKKKDVEILPAVCPKAEGCVVAAPNPNAGLAAVAPKAVVPVLVAVPNPPKAGAAEVVAVLPNPKAVGFCCCWVPNSPIDWG